MTDPSYDDHGLPYQPRRVSPRPGLVAYGVLMLAIAVVLAWCVKAEAHELYTGLQSPNGADCCSNRDCRPVPWRDNGGIIEYNLDGVWVRGAPYNLIAPIDDQAHACWNRDGVGAGIVPPQPRCVSPPGFGA